jgi:hypothetical protein
MDMMGGDRCIPDARGFADEGDDGPAKVKRKLKRTIPSTAPNAVSGSVGSAGCDHKAPPQLKTMPAAIAYIYIYIYIYMYRNVYICIYIHMFLYVYIYT